MASDEATSRFPFINLEKSLSRAQALFAGDKSGKPMAIPTAFELWGYSPKSSGGFQTISALKSYGLLEDEGANSERRVKLTAAARRFFLDERDDIRNGMLKDFALSPSLFAVLWHRDKWSEGIPADTVARSHLKIERGLNDQSARALLGIFKENMHFAGMHAGQPEGHWAESSVDTRVDANPEEAHKDSAVQQVHATPAPSVQMPTPLAAGKPIVFDMATVTVSAVIDSAEDLQKFIDDLAKLKPLMPSKNG